MFWAVQVRAQVRGADVRRRQSEVENLLGQRKVSYISQKDSGRSDHCRNKHQCGMQVSLFFTLKICLLTCRRVRSCSKTSKKTFSCSRVDTQILISPSHLLMKCFIKKLVSLTSDSYCSKWQALKAFKPIIIQSLLLILNFSLSPYCTTLLQRFISLWQHIGIATFSLKCYTRVLKFHVSVVNAACYFGAVISAAMAQRKHCVPPVISASCPMGWSFLPRICLSDCRRKITQ